MAQNSEYTYGQLSGELEIKISGVIDGFGGCSGGICHTVNIGPNSRINGPYFFEKCPNLITVRFDGKILITSNNTFLGCSSLKTLNAPHGFRLFGNGTFARCGFRVLVIPKGTVFDGDYSFGECLDLISVLIEDHVVFIGNNTFKDCSNLSIVRVGNNVKFLGNGTFSGCGRLETLRLGKDVSVLGEDNFVGCRNITTSTHEENLVITDKSFTKYA